MFGRKFCSTTEVIDALGLHMTPDQYRRRSTVGAEEVTRLLHPFGRNGEVVELVEVNARPEDHLPAAATQDRHTAKPLGVVVILENGAPYMAVNREKGAGVQRSHEQTLRAVNRERPTETIHRADIDPRPISPRGKGGHHGRPSTEGMHDIAVGLSSKLRKRVRCLERMLWVERVLNNANGNVSRGELDPGRHSDCDPYTERHQFSGELQPQSNGFVAN